MEQEIDLRPYIVALMRRWRVIVLATLAVALLAIAVAALMPQAPQASANVLILATEARVRFDQRFTTDNPSPLTTPANQRTALIALASSTALEDQVKQQLPADFSVEPLQPGALASQVRVSTEGDLLSITVANANPERAQQLASLWAEQYVKLVNEAYGQDTTLIQNLQTQLDEAQQRYDEKQGELETFLGQSQLVQLEQQIKGIEGVLDGSREASQMLYTQYLSRTHELELVLNDAQTLRQQVQEGQASNVSQSLANLILQARAVSSTSGAPLDLRLESPTTFQQDDQATIASLDNLVLALQERRRQLLVKSTELAKAIATGGSTESGLTTEQRKQYEQDLTALNQQFEQVRATRQVLEQQRDVLRESLKILQSKLDEQRVAEGTSQAEVRYLGTTMEPPSSLLTRLALSGVAAAVVVFFLSVVLILFVDVVRPRLHAMQLAPSPERTSTERAAAD
jgi:capsular polysaccharide biosynthesis protein